MTVTKQEPLTERTWERQLTTDLEAAGALVLPLGSMLRARQARKMARYSEGWPDLQVWHYVWSGWLELKVGAKRYSKDQCEKLSDLRRHGMKSCGLRLVDDEVQIEHVSNDGISAAFHPFNYTDATDLLRRLRGVG